MNGKNTFRFVYINKNSLKRKSCEWQIEVKNLLFLLQNIA